MYRLCRSVYLFIGILILLPACIQHKKQWPALPSAPDILHQNQEQLTQVIIYDVFTPPVASRIYVYSSLASYEAIRFSKKGTPSITEKLNGFGKMPVPAEGQTYQYVLAATKAFFTVVRNVKVFSVDSLKTYEASVYENFKATLDAAVYQRSIDFGEAVGNAILIRAKNDGYTKSRGKPKYLGSNDIGKWRPTPPDYLEGVEWCWNTMQPMVLDSASQFMPPRPPVFSTDTNSVFFKAVKEVYAISKHLTAEQQTIARYWDDNPFVMEHSGHLMFGNKKITPGGHWMGITAIAAKTTGADEIKTAKAYACTAIALYDAFISCWDEKYRSNYIRPVTVINQSIEQTWTSFLQTPPFPEYTSGHSTITRAAATVLSKMFGDQFSFQDTSDLAYIGMQRHFDSFVQAAEEASISRVYGGIHYRFSVDAGAEAGKKVGNLIVDKLMR